MKELSVKIILFALIVLNILDGDFKSPSILDIIKFVLLAVCLILCFFKGENNNESKAERD